MFACGQGIKRLLKSSGSVANISADTEKTVPKVIWWKRGLEIWLKAETFTKWSRAQTGVSLQSATSALSTAAVDLLFSYSPLSPRLIYSLNTHFSGVIEFSQLSQLLHSIRPTHLPPADDCALIPAVSVYSLTSVSISADSSARCEEPAEGRGPWRGPGSR